MPVTIPDREAGRSPLWRRIAWFVALYALGVLAVGIVAYGLRLWIKPAPVHHQAVTQERIRFDS